MKIAITDACIFIDLYELSLTVPFFGLPLEIHTSVDVFKELYPEQKAPLSAFESVGKLIIHNIPETDRKTIMDTAYPNTLSASDKTVLFLAEKHNAILLSSDKRMRHNAKVRSVEYHGMVWIVEQLVDNSLIASTDAINKLNTMVNTNIIYQNNTELIAEINKRIKKWQPL